MFLWDENHNDYNFLCGVTYTELVELERQNNLIGQVFQFTLVTFFEEMHNRPDDYFTFKAVVKDIECSESPAGKKQINYIIVTVEDKGKERIVIPKETLLSRLNGAVLRDKLVGKSWWVVRYV